MHNIMGMDGFTWFFGIVENRNDPLKVGRCQVRVYYWNEKSKSTLPTEQLIWAQSILPLNSKTISAPPEGTMVFGFYVDGAQAQNPMIMGWVPGIPDQSPADPSEGFNDPRTPEQLQSAPRPPQNVDYSTSGRGVTINEAQSAQRYPFILNEPNTYRTARNENIQDTVIGQRQNSTVTQIPVGTGAIAMAGIDLEAAQGLALSIGIPPFSAGINIGGQFEICGLSIGAGISAGLQFSGIALTLPLPNISLFAGLNLAVDLFGCLLAGLKVGGGIQIDGGMILPLLPQNKFINIQQIGVRGTTYGGIPLGTMGGIPMMSQPMWNEPPPPYNAQYPYNNAYQSDSGHVVEVDDTPGYERIHTFHRSGTFTEMQPDGSKVDKVTKNAYSITMADNNNLVMGDHNNTVNGQQTNLVQQDKKETIQGAETVIVNSDATKTIMGNRIATIIKDSQETIIQNRLTGIKGDDTLIVQGNKNELIQGDYNLTVEGNVNLSIGKKWTIQVAIETEHTVPVLNVIAGEEILFTTPIFDVAADTEIEFVTPLFDIKGYTKIEENLDVTGSVHGSAGSASSVGLQTHTHTQGSDSHGDAETPTNAPTAGT